MARKLYTREELVRALLDDAFRELEEAHVYRDSHDAFLYEYAAHAFYIAAWKAALDERGVLDQKWPLFTEWKAWAYAAIDQCAANSAEAVS